MRRYPFFLMLLAGLIAGSLAFSENPALAQNGMAQPEGAIATSEDADTDAAIRDRLRAVFRELEELRNVFVTVQSGVVTLKGRVLSLDAVAEAERLAARVQGVASVRNDLQVETAVDKRIVPALERIEQRLLQGIAFLPLVGLAFLVFAIIAGFGFLIARLRNPWDRITPNRFVGNLVRHVLRLVFILAGLVVALDLLGATALLGTIVGAAGILGLAVGFAVRDTVENYISSIMLSLRQPFRPEDYVRIGDQEGLVMALTSRATILMTLDGNHIRIPNAVVFKSIITNFTLNPSRRFEFELGVETEDLRRAVDLGLEVIGKLDFVLDDPPPDGWVNGIGDSSMILWFGGWIDQNETHLAKARAEAIRLVKTAFEAEGIGLPEPIYRLRFDPGAMPAALEETQKPQSRRGSSGKKPRTDNEATIAVQSDVEPDRMIERQMQEKRIPGKGNNLLDPDAPQEIR